MEQTERNDWTAEEALMRVDALADMVANVETNTLSDSTLGFIGLMMREECEKAMACIEARPKDGGSACPA